MSCLHYVLKEELPQGWKQRKRTKHLPNTGSRVASIHNRKHFVHRRWGKYSAAKTIQDAPSTNQLQPNVQLTSPTTSTMLMQMIKQCRKFKRRWTKIKHQITQRKQKPCYQGGVYPVWSTDQPKSAHNTTHYNMSSPCLQDNQSRIIIAVFKVQTTAVDYRISLTL